MNFSEYEHSLNVAKDLVNLNKIVKNILASFAITAFTFTFYNFKASGKHKIKYEFCSENYLPWHRHYLSENYDEVDTTLSEEQKNNLPVFWDIQQQLQAAKTKREKKMREDSLTFGVSKGLSIPVYLPNGDFANFMIAQMQGQTCLENWQSKQYDLFIIAYYYTHYLQSHLLHQQTKQNKSNLSAREIECLQLTAQQYSVEHIAKKLKITPRTVNFHLQNINKKLGSKNKHNSANLALKLGLISL